MGIGRKPTRRKFLAASGITVVTGVAGCSTDSDDDRTDRTTGTLTRATRTTTERRGTPTPTATETTEPPSDSGPQSMLEGNKPIVFVPSIRHGMRLAGIEEVGPYTVSMSYTFAHDFWLLTGRKTSYVAVEPGQVMHLMTTVWDPEYGQVIPLGSPTVEITDAESGDVVTEKSPWPMLSQQMGPHFGDNVALPEEGAYTARVTLNPLSVRQLGEYQERFTESVDLTFDLPFRYTIMNNIREVVVDDSGVPGAFDPMEMASRPVGTVPKPLDLPGQHGGIAESGDATFAVQVLETTPAGIDSSAPYLAISPRTPYNRYPLPAMGLRATVSEGSERLFRDTVSSAIHPELGYHYGTPVPGLSMGDELLLEVGAPPQVARPRGYQTAFMKFDDMSLTLGEQA